LEKPKGLKKERRSRERRTRKGQGVRRAREKKMERNVEENK